MTLDFLVKNENVTVINEIKTENIERINEAINEYYAKGSITDHMFLRIGSGYNGVVFKFDSGTEQYAVKVKKRGRAHGNLEDYKYLIKLQKSKYFPKPYYYVEEKVMVSKFIDGKMLARLKYNSDFSFCKPIDINHIQMQAEECIEDIFSCQVVSGDIHSENILINEVTGMFTIVDVGEFFDLTTSYTTKNNGDSNYLETDLIDIIKKYNRNIELALEKQKIDEWQNKLTFI